MENLKKAFELIKKHADKIAHFAVNYCIVLAAGIFRNGWLVFIGVLIAVVVSVSKEIWDKVTGNGVCDWRDLVADAIGIVSGLIFTGIGAIV